MRSENNKKIRTKLYECERCEAKTASTYGFNEEVLCESCFNDEIDKAEYAYEASREIDLNPIIGDEK